MESWLKKAEQEQNRHSDKGERVRAHIRQRRELIDANSELIGDDYRRLITMFMGLTSRVNNLPMDRRQQFGKIRFAFKQTQLNNQLHIISTSRKVTIRKFSFLLPFLRRLRVKHIRVLFITVSREKGFVELEFKESLLQKRDIRKDETSEQSRNRDTHRRIDLLYTLPVNSVSEEICYQIIDWLSFQLELEKVSLDPSALRDISKRPDKH